MLTEALFRHSLKTRILLVTLALFVAAIWSLLFFAGRILQHDMEHFLGEQQFSTVTYIADRIDKDLSDRITALELIAGRNEMRRIDKPEALQRFLEARITPRGLFNAGFFAAGLDGTVIADVPASSGRTGANYHDLDYMRAALQEGKAAVGRPVSGEQARSMAIVIAVPIRSGDGRVIGALCGATRLDEPNFLDQITENHFGRAGGYLLVARKDRLIITATDKSRVMEAMPPPGVIPQIDRYLEGREETAIFINHRGERILASTKNITRADWFVATMLPTEEAFAPISGMRRRMLIAALFLTLLAGGLSGWVLRRQFQPLETTVKRLAAMAASGQPQQPLPIVRADEIGQLIGGFNALLAVLGERETALQESEERFRALHNASFGGILIHDKGVILDCNQGLADITGYPREELIGMYTPLLIAPAWREQVIQIIRNGIEQPYEAEFLHKDGTLFPVSICGKTIPYRGRTVRVAEIRDTTEQKQAEQQQRIAAIAFETQEGMFITDAGYRIVRVNQAFAKMTGYPVEEILGQVPLFLGAGRHPPEFFEALMEGLERNGCWQGEIWNRRKNGEEYPAWVTITGVRDGIGAISHYVVSINDITQRKMAEEEIRRLAFFDHLTGLPNRRLLADRLKQALAASCRHHHCGALLFIDLDNFKTLNDTLGHDQGDLLLQQVAQRLSVCVREGDTVARIGGDEFVVMLESLSDNLQEAAAQAETVGEKIIASLSRPYRFPGYEHHTTASIGIAMFLGCNDMADELLKRADMAMYQAKAAGRNTLRFFDPDMQAVVSARVAMEAGLREAVRQNRFVLYYQPQVDTAHRVIGAEVLLRWRDPEKGLVSPIDFIPLAEETGLILPIGQWVLETACECLTAWATQPALAHLTIAVNISARQFRQKNFVDQVLAALERSGANPQRLKLELTESMLVHDVNDVIEKMTALQAKGVGFSLDDFGTGYSSLAYLKRLPLDQLKIDRGFVRDILTDPDVAAIARTIIALADSLGLSVIAEGVETKEQRQMLARKGCHAYQGYLFSRPLPLADFEAYIDDWAIKNWSINYGFPT